MRKLLAGLAAMLVAACTTTSQKSSDIAPAMSVDDSARIAPIIARYDVPSMSFAVIERGRITRTGTYGWQSPDHPADDNTLYNAASLTKPVAAQTVLKLVDMGLVDLDEPMADYWVDPDLVDDPRVRLLTPRIALSHQTGFANWRRHTEDKLQFAWEPGSDTSYAGEGFLYLVNFVEAKTGRAFEDWTRELVFEPAGMEDSFIVAEPGFEDRLAWRYYPPRGGWYEPRTIEETNGADQLRTTAADYARFFAMVASGEGLSDGIDAERRTITRDLVQSFCLEREARPEACPPTLGHGLGIMIYDYPDGPILAHGGHNTGLFSMAFYDTSRHWGVAVFANGEAGDYAIWDLIGQLYDRPDYVEISRPSKPFGGE